MRIRIFRNPDGAGGGAGGDNKGGDGKGGGAATNLMQHVGEDEKAGGGGGQGGDGKGGGGAGGPSRPDWLPENFFKNDARDLKPEDLKLLSHIDIEALARSQADLRSKFGRGEHKPPAKPDDYTFEMPKDVKLEIKADDPLMASVRSAAHAAGLSNADFNKFLQPVVTKLGELVASGAGAKQLTPEQQQEAARQAQAQQAAAFDKELQKLGPTGREAVRQVGTWIKGLGTKGILTEAEVTELSYLSTAEGITAMRKLMELSGEKPVPVDPMSAGAEMSIEEAKRLMTEAFAEGGDTNEKSRAKLERARKTLQAYEKNGMLAAS